MGCTASKSVKAASLPGVHTTISLSLLKEQTSRTSAAIVDAFSADAKFVEFSKKQTAGILKRDADDDAQLAKGIQAAIAKNVIPANVEVEPVTKVDVYNKTAEAVADEIIARLGDAASKGCVLTLEGLSGTGKGTTVACLKEKLNNATTWSNGNLFRSITLLAVSYSEQNNCTLEEALTPELLATFMTMIKFDKFDGKFDVEINGLGIKAYVSKIENTDLKLPKVGKNIPTVAGVTQGEVINFVQEAMKLMVADGLNVLLEGRAQTLNYIRTPHRFQLVLSDEQIIGKRRAAQRMMAEAVKTITNPEASEEDVMKALGDCLEVFAKEE